MGLCDVHKLVYIIGISVPSALDGLRSVRLVSTQREQHQLQSRQIRCGLHEAFGVQGGCMRMHGTLSVMCHA